LERSLADLPSHVADEGSLAAALAAASERVRLLDAALEAARNAATETATRREHASATLASAETSFESAERKLADMRRRVAEALAGAHFETEAAMRAALRSDAEIDVEEQALARFERDRAAAHRVHDEASREATGLVAPDLEALAAAAEAHADALEARTREAAQATARVVQLEELRRNVAQRETEHAKLEREFVVVGRIAEVADGKNAAGLPFHRYVLATMLDSVLEVASVRLRQMSRGRYLLVRSTERGDQRSTTGLEIEVEDSYTGTRRTAATLSGGESFLAALSLALGLAEVVQESAGGVRLDSVFVDEGFGSLDPESLELAVAALSGLQQSGRLVGVISHVAEMRERIDVRLEVDLARDGSRARFHLP
jgi:exonuclease SbcC